jgi:hypothetical protein
LWVPSVEGWREQLAVEVEVEGVEMDGKRGERRRNWGWQVARGATAIAIAAAAAAAAAATKL